ncbi:MAG: DUF5320 domain-containing protein [Bacteroidales bacterium]|nr:DUF5320 domain-containing protein [Bacteroidales bacterium]
MPKMDGTGPEGKGAETGRKLGNCNQHPDDEQSSKFGKGLGKKRHMGGGQGKGKRLKYNDTTNQ